MRLDLSLSSSHLQQSSLHDASTRREIPSQYAANPLPPRHFLSEYLSLPLGISLYLFPSLSLSLFTFLPSLMYPHILLCLCSPCLISSIPSPSYSSSSILLAPQSTPPLFPLYSYSFLLPSFDLFDNQPPLPHHPLFPLNSSSCFCLLRTSSILSLLIIIVPCFLYTPLRSSASAVSSTLLFLLPSSDLFDPQPHPLPPLFPLHSLLLLFVPRPPLFPLRSSSSSPPCYLLPMFI